MEKIRRSIARHACLVTTTATFLLYTVQTVQSSYPTAPGWNNSTDVTRVVQFSNSLVPPLFYHYSRGRDNLVLAPFGVATSVAMMLEGLQGQAAHEITSLFKLRSNGVRQKLRRGFKIIFDAFGDDSDSDFVDFYNKASVTSSRIMSSSYINKLSKYYQANVTTIQSDNSNNRSGSGRRSYPCADTLELRSDTGIISHWKNYEKLAPYTYISYKSSAPFTRADSSIVHVPMIPQTGSFKIGYVPQLKCVAVELMFETDKVSMLIMMPDDVDGSELMMERLSKDNFLEILDSLVYQDVEVLIPQLAAFTNTLNLEPFFRELGVKTVFELQSIGQVNVNGRSANDSSPNGVKAEDGSISSRNTRGSTTIGGSAVGGNDEGDRVKGGSAIGGSAIGGSAEGDSAKGNSDKNESVIGESASGGNAKGISDKGGRVIGGSAIGGNARDGTAQEISGKSKSTIGGSTISGSVIGGSAKNESTIGRSTIGGSTVGGDVIDVNAKGDCTKGGNIGGESASGKNSKRCSDKGGNAQGSSGQGGSPIIGSVIGASDNSANSGNTSSGSSISGSVTGGSSHGGNAIGGSAEDVRTNDGNAYGSNAKNGSAKSDSPNSDSAHKTLTGHTFKSPTVPLVSMKQNAYFSMSFVTINSVGSVGTKLGIRPSVVQRKKRSDASKVVFDRPFVFFVFNKLTGLILLTGKITNPTQVPS